MLRDQRPDIPYPGHWDLPGGGREGDESPQACALRETNEEFGLHLNQDIIQYSTSRDGGLPGKGITWFFGVEMPNLKPAHISFGTEGQKWLLMPLGMFITHPLAVPHLSELLAEWLADKKRS